jgi:hypothetical protein
MSVGNSGSRPLSTQDPTVFQVGRLIDIKGSW